MKGYMMTLWVFPPRFCAMVFVAAMVFFVEAPAGAIIACELCLLMRKRETAVEFHVREGVLRVAVSALFFVCVSRAIFFKCTSDQRSWCLGVCFGVLVASTHQGNVAWASPLC